MKAIFLHISLGFSGSIWAHVGPARALEEREKYKKNLPLFLRNTFLFKIFVFGLQTAFFYGFSVLLSFLAEKSYRTNMKSPQKASLEPETCEV